jgi:hypothetical protein
LKGAIVLNFFRPDRSQFERFLVDADENKILMGFCFPAFPAKDVLVRLLTAPDHGQERNTGRKMQTDHHHRDKGANARENRQAMSAKPMHGGIISENVEIRMSNVEGNPNAERTKRRQHFFVIRASSFLASPSVEIICHFDLTA